jgi:hypothetical protein
MYAQGDLLIERVGDACPTGTRIAAGSDGATVLAEGEVSGHRHAIYENVVFFRDDGLARDIPGGLYIGHVNVEDRADIRHDEHSTVSLRAGTYRVRRQRELDPREARLVAD